MKGETLMRKRHLEILGYFVVQVRKQHQFSPNNHAHRHDKTSYHSQIPHFEWNSMELSTQDAWKEYLKKKIFLECSNNK